MLTQALAIGQYRKRLFAKLIEQKLAIRQQLANVEFQRKTIL
jgi:hypothetical protein